MKEERKPCLHAHVKWFYGQSERAYYLNYFIMFFITYFAVIPTKTYTTLVLKYLYPCMIELRRKSHNLSQKSLFWTSKQPLAIHSFIASYDVCPVAIPELFAQNSFITSLLWRIKYKCQEGQDPLLHRIASFNFLFETKILPTTGSPIAAQLEVSKIYSPFQAYSARRCEKKSVYS